MGSVREASASRRVHLHHFCRGGPEVPRAAMDCDASGAGHDGACGGGDASAAHDCSVPFEELAALLRVATAHTHPARRARFTERFAAARAGIASCCPAAPGVSAATHVYSTRGGTYV